MYNMDLNGLARDKMYKEAMMTWGLDAQLGQVMEEAAEVILAIRHVDRGREGFDKIIEEAADVLLMSLQVRYLFPDEFDEILQFKVNRTKERLKKYKEKPYDEKGCYSSGSQ